MDNWKQNETLILVREIQKHFILYNPLDQHFTNKIKKNHAYLCILEEVKKVKENVTLHDIKTKIKTLQTRLSKVKAKIISLQIGGVEMDEIFQQKLWYYNYLSFLNNITDSEPSEPNLDLTKFGIEYAEEAIEDKTQQRRERNEAEFNLQKKIQDIFLTAKRLLNHENKKSPKTKEEQFCEFLCTMLNKLKLKNSFDEVTVEILQQVANKVEEEKLQQSELFQFNKRRSTSQTSSTPTPPSSVSSDFSQYSTLSYCSSFVGDESESVFDNGNHSDEENILLTN